eukprot:gnl/TRDRNA2_/TRDRNA2_155014_c0_seq4.p1 gnl/TRDRNA2_/TRDRNA2_155014_c0~~gnl/TRDRNA2_/TRDRNA2_155014_c0_seq4.p1  ORF type:complete len:205 (+),score=17.54 gnl/TRDRNA2_/TRDRNA2_155014_c0_seq4:75-689(+)
MLKEERPRVTCAVSRIEPIYSIPVKLPSNHRICTPRCAASIGTTGSSDASETDISTMSSRPHNGCTIYDMCTPRSMDICTPRPTDAEGRSTTVRTAIFAVRGSIFKMASNVIDAATTRISEMYTEDSLIAHIHQTALSWCEHTEALIDRWLPELDVKPKEDDDEHSSVDTKSLIPRTLALRFLISERPFHSLRFTRTASPSTSS